MLWKAFELDRQQFFYIKKQAGRMEEAMGNGILKNKIFRMDEKTEEF